MLIERKTQRLESQIQRILKDIDACIARLLTAIEVERAEKRGIDESTAVARRVRETANDTLTKVLKTQSGPESYYFKSILEQLVEARRALVEIDVGRVFPTRRLGGSTTNFYEDKLRVVRNNIDQRSIGILDQIKDLANESYSRPSEVSLHLLYELRGKCLMVRRKVTALERPIVGFAFSRTPAVLLLAIALVVATIMYAIRATESHHSTVVVAVKSQLTTDRDRVRKALDEPGKSSIERGKGALDQLSETISVVPKALGALSLLLAFIQYAFLQQRWRQRSIDVLRGDLAAAAESLRDWSAS